MDILGVEYFPFTATCIDGVNVQYMGKSSPIKSKTSAWLYGFWNCSLLWQQVLMEFMYLGKIGSIIIIVYRSMAFWFISHLQQLVLMEVKSRMSMS